MMDLLTNLMKSMTLGGMTRWIGIAQHENHLTRFVEEPSNDGSRSADKRDHSTKRLAVKRAGMSLVEVTATMALLVIGMTSVFDAMHGANKASKRAEYRNQALAAIQTQIEVIQAMPNEDTTVRTEFPVAGLPGAKGSTMAGKVVRKRAADGGINFLLTVNWEDAGGPDSVSMSYFFVSRT